MRRVLYGLAVASLVGPLAVASATSAGASTKAGGIRVEVAKASPSSNVLPDFSGPKAKIVGEGTTAVYKPTAVTMAEDTSGGNCNPFISELKIKNKGSATAYLTDGGSPFGTLPAGATTFVCSYGYGPGAQIVLGLSNKKDTKTFASTLTITTSD